MHFQSCPVFCILPLDKKAIIFLYSKPSEVFMNETMEILISGFDEQLTAMYAEKEQLENALGISSADDIILMVRSLEEQLNALYADAA